MHSDAYKESKKKGLRELLRQMQSLMSKGQGDEPMEGDEVKVAVAEATEGDADEAAAHCDECNGEGCEACADEDMDPVAEGSDEPTDVNASAEDDSEESEDGDAAEPDFKQTVRDYLSNKPRSRPAKKSLVVRPKGPAANLPAAIADKGKGNAKKRA